MEELDGRVFMLDVGVSFIQRLSFPGGTVNVLVEFRERKHYLQISMVKNPPRSNALPLGGCFVAG